jgi:quercetin dioxygenase-like cupin family protein
MRYTRIYSDANGVSRFEDLELGFAAAEFAPPAPPVDVSDPMPASAVLVLRFAAGWTDPAHPAPARQLMVISAGAGEVTAGGETRRFETGAVLVLEDTEGDGHATTFLEDSFVVAVRLA